MNPACGVKSHYQKILIKCKATSKIHTHLHQNTGMVTSFFLESIKYIRHINFTPTRFLLSLLQDPKNKPAQAYLNQKLSQCKHWLIPIILQCDILILLNYPTPRKILHPYLFSLVNILRPTLCYLQHGQQFCGKRMPSIQVVSKLWNWVPLVMIFDEYTNSKVFQANNPLKNPSSHLYLCHLPTISFSSDNFQFLWIKD